MYKEIHIWELFPLCGLSQKADNLARIINRRKRTWKAKNNGVTKKMIIKLLNKERTVKDLSIKLYISQGSINEHMRSLEKTNKIIKCGKLKQATLWKKVG